MSTLTIYRGHAFLVGCAGGPEKRVGYLGYSSKHKWFCVTEVNAKGTLNYNYFREFPEAVAYYESIYPGVGAKADMFISASEDWSEFKDKDAGWGWLRDKLCEWGDAWSTSHSDVTTEWERRAGDKPTRPAKTKPEPKPEPELIDPTPGPILIGGYIHSTTEGMCRLVIRNKAGKYVMGFWGNGGDEAPYLEQHSDLAPLQEPSADWLSELPINQLAINYNRNHRIPLNEEAFKIIKENCLPAYKWLEENGVDMPLGKQSVNITLYRGHCGTADSGTRAAYFVAEKEGKFYYVRHSSNNSPPTKAEECPSLEAAIKKYEYRCKEFKAGPGELYIDRYNDGGKKCELGGFQMELRGMHHGWVSRDVTSFWRMGKEEPTKETLKIYRGHWREDKACAFVAQCGDKYYFFRGGTLGMIEKMNFEEALQSYVGYSIAPAHQDCYSLQDGTHKNISLANFWELVIKDYPKLAKKYTPAVGDEAPIAKQVPPQPPSRLKLEEQGWELDGATIQVQSRYDGAFLLWSKGKPYNKEYRIESLGMGPTYATAVYRNKTEAIEHAHAICKNVRAELERKGDVCGLDGVNDFGLGISKLGDQRGSFTLNRREYVEHDLLMLLREKYLGSGYAQRVWKILENESDARALRVSTASMRGGRMIGPEYVQALTGTMSPAPAEFSLADLQNQIELLKDAQAKWEAEFREQLERQRWGVMKPQTGPGVLEAEPVRVGPTPGCVLQYNGKEWAPQPPARTPEAQRQYDMGMNDEGLPRPLWAFNETYGYWVAEGRGNGSLRFMIAYGENCLSFESNDLTRDRITVYLNGEWTDVPNFTKQLDSEGEQDMSNAKENPIEAALPTEAERSILEKYKDEIKDMELQKVIANLEAIKQEQDKNLALARAESRKLKTTKKKRATMMQTMSLSAVFTLLTYIILARVFGRPVPNLELTQPKRRLRKGRRRERAEEQASSGPIAALAPPLGDPIPEARVRNRQRVAR